MAEDCVDQAATLAQLPERPCATHHLRIHAHAEPTKTPDALGVYGADKTRIQALIADHPALGERLHCVLPYLKAEVVWAAREEMARTVEDVLARRTRALFLNARAALEMAPTVADLMAAELSWSEAEKQTQLAGFRPVAANYVLTPAP
jgi:glycerol-3-phosphate dehydrogenase